MAAHVVPPAIKAFRQHDRILRVQVLDGTLRAPKRIPLASLEVPILDTDVSQRVGFAEAVASGQTVLEPILIG
jgi:hypothetical protein